MSQRLIDERQRRIIAILPSGFPVYALAGADPEGQETKEQPPEEPEKETTAPAGKTYTEEEFQALANRMAAADRAKSEAEKKVTEFERAGQSEVEKLTTDLQNAIAERDALRAERDAAVIGREILKFPGYDWHDPDTALALIDTDDIEIKDGKVQGVKEAVSKLAKDKPFLLKTKPGSGKEVVTENNGTPSGHNPAGTSKPGDAAQQRERLITKYKL